MASDRELVLDFLQSAHALPDLVGSSPAGLARWLGERGLVDGPVAAGAEDCARARHLRAALRSVAGGRDAADGRSAAAIGEVGERAEARFRLVDGELVLAAVGAPVDGALAAVVAAFYRLQLSGELARLKSCRKCGFAFWDASKNRSRVWCDMGLCGSREKATAYRRRKGALARGEGGAG